MKYKEKRTSRNSDLRKASGESKEGSRKESEYVNRDKKQEFMKKRKGATKRREIRKRKM